MSSADDEDNILSLPDALLQRYDINIEEQLYKIDSPESSTRDNVRNGMIIPSVIALDGYDVTHAGDSTKIRELCSKVREMHLPSNRLRHWHDVFVILANMPLLQFLNLTSNNLSGELSLFSMHSGDMHFQSLQKLVLNGTNTSWSVLNQLLLNHLPNLEHIHISLNGYTNVELSSALRCPSMHSIHFNGNPVRDWHEICKLGKAFPNLDTLVMEDNLISSVSAKCALNAELSQHSRIDSPQPEDLDNAKVFPNLRSLNIANCKLSSWEEFDELNSFPSMVCCRVRRTPLVQEHDHSLSRQLCIARLPHITKLNGSEITENERQDAERALMRHYLDAPDKPPIYSVLEAKHGKLDPLAEVNLCPKTRINVRLIYKEQIENRVINLYQTVLQLKHELKTFTGLPASKIRLHYVDVELNQCMGPEEMKFNNKMLYTYGIHENDHILIDQRA